MRTFLFLAALLAAPVIADEDLPVVCISQPPLQLVAGVTNVSAIQQNLFAERCRALLSFSNPDFAPISFHLPSTAPCAGSQVASFLLPAGVPNGEARVVWQCPGGSPSCSYANITNGTADASLSGSHQNGTVGCMLVLESGPPISQTSASPSACLSPGPSAGSSVNATPQWSNNASVPGSLTMSTQSSLGPPFLNTSAQLSVGASVQASLTMPTQSSSGSLSAGGAPGTTESSVPSGTTPTSAVDPAPQASSGDGVDSAATRLSIRTSIIFITSTITSTITLF